MWNNTGPNRHSKQSAVIMVRDFLGSTLSLSKCLVAATLALGLVSAACDGCKEKPAEPDVGVTTGPPEDTGPDEPVDPLAEAREKAESDAVSAAVHLSDITRAVGAEIEAQANKPKRKPKPRIKKDRENGKLAKKQLNRVFNSHASAMKKCYERALKKSPGLRGKVSLELRIRRDGSVRDARVRGSSLSNPAVHGCMTREAMGMKFPKPKGGAVRVAKTYAFAPEL